MTLKDKYKIFSRLTALEESQEVQKYTKEETNFGYDDKYDILKDLYDEIDELKKEMFLNEKQDNKRRIFEELGDVLFVLGNLANRYNISSTEALRHSVNEFERRIIYCEEHCNGRLKETPMEMMLNLWKDAKNNFK